MPREADDLLRAARDELYHMRVVANGLRNRVKTDAALIADSERHLEALIDEIEAALIPTPEGGPGSNGNHEALSQAHH